MFKDVPARVEPDKVFENSLFKMPLEDDINSVRLVSSWVLLCCPSVCTSIADDALPVSKVLLVSNVGSDDEESFEMCFDSDAASSCF